MPIFKPKYSPEPKNFLKNFFKIFTHVWPKNFFKIFFRNFFVVKVEKKIIRGQTIVNEGILSHFYYKIFFTPQNVSSTRASALVIMSLKYCLQKTSNLKVIFAKSPPQTNVLIVMHIYRKSLFEQYPLSDIHKATILFKYKMHIFHEDTRLLW